MPIKIKAVYDNGGKTFDRYSIYIDEKERSGLYSVLGCSSNPTSPQGFSQFSSGMLGPHNGKRIAFSDLPKNVQKHVLFRLGLVKTKVPKKKRTVK